MLCFKTIPLMFKCFVFVKVVRESKALKRTLYLARVCYPCLNCVSFCLQQYRQKKGKEGKADLNLLICLKSLYYCRSTNLWF